MHRDLFGIARIVLSAALFVALAAFAGLALLPVTTGAEVRAVVSGSMEPTIERGAVVFSMPVDPAEVRAGDVVMFHEPGQPERVITHRVSEVLSREPLQLSTVGDANERPDGWIVGEQDLLGRVRWDVPKLGYLVTHINSTPGFVLLLVVPSVLLLAGEVRLWYRFIRYGDLEGPPQHPQSHGGLLELLGTAGEGEPAPRGFGRA